MWSGYCLYKYGWHKWTNRFDERGNQVEESYFGIDEKPSLHRNGLHR